MIEIDEKMASQFLRSKGYTVVHWDSARQAAVDGAQGLLGGYQPYAGWAAAAVAACAAVWWAMRTWRSFVTMRAVLRKDALAAG